MSKIGHLGFRTCQGPDQVLSKSAQNVYILGPLFGGPKWGPEWVHFRALKWSIFGPLAGDPLRGHRAYLGVQNRAQNGSHFGVPNGVHFGVPNGSQMGSDLDSSDFTF